MFNIFRMVCTCLTFSRFIEAECDIVACFFDGIMICGFFIVKRTEYAVPGNCIFCNGFLQNLNSTV